MGQGGIENPSRLAGHAVWVGKGDAERRAVVGHGSVAGASAGEPAAGPQPGDFVSGVNGNVIEVASTHLVG